MDGEEFLVRINLSTKVATASKLRTESLHFGKRSERAAKQKTITEFQTGFANDGLKYIRYLLDGVLGLVGLNTHLVKGLKYIRYLIDGVLGLVGLNTYIVKGLATFDSYILLKRPTATALVTLSCCIPFSNCGHGSLLKPNSSAEMSTWNFWITYGLLIRPTSICLILQKT